MQIFTFRTLNAILINSLPSELPPSVRKSACLNLSVFLEWNEKLANIQIEVEIQNLLVNAFEYESFIRLVEFDNFRHGSYHANLLK